LAEWELQNSTAPALEPLPLPRVSWVHEWGPSRSTMARPACNTASPGVTILCCR